MQRTETIRSISTHFEYHIISSNCDLKTTFNFFFQICLLDYYSEANTNKIESAIHTVAVRLKIGQQNITTEPNRTERYIKKYSTSKEKITHQRVCTSRRYSKRFIRFKAVLIFILSSFNCYAILSRFHKIAQRRLFMAKSISMN